MDKSLDSGYIAMLTSKRFTIVLPNAPVSTILLAMNWRRVSKKFLTGKFDGRGGDEVIVRRR